MHETHLREVEMALAADGEVAVEVARHLRWCRRCRSAVQEYRWLQQEIAAALATGADMSPVPGPRWREVRERLGATRRKLVAEWRPSALAGIVLVVGVLLVISSVVGTAIVASAVPPEATRAPSPVTAIASGEDGFSTPTPPQGVSYESSQRSLTPAVVLYPTPSEPQTVTRLP